MKMNRLTSKHNKSKTFFHIFPQYFVLCIILFLFVPRTYAGDAKYIILMIADGCGIKHHEATNAYTGSTPAYQSGSSWKKHWMSTYPSGGSYDGNAAWSNFDYVIQNGSTTDSAAAATALYTGVKTANKRISVSSGGIRLFNIGEKAKANQMAVGAISSVPVSHATPGAWMSHNNDRSNGYAIADESFFENPNTTGSGSLYNGGKGPTAPRSDVIIGDGFNTSYVNAAIRNLLASESGQLGKHKLVTWSAGQNGSNALMAEANKSSVTRLAGLFKHVYHQANFSGFDSRNPTLAISTNAALTVLSRNPNGFVLMIEGGAVDWAGHTNIMDDMIGEQKDFDNAVQAVINWVTNSGNGSNWNNSLVIVTSDHECGHLTAGLNLFPDDANPITNVNNATLAKEKVYTNIGGNLRASWEDSDSDNFIDAGETVYWAWHSRGHSNSLVPLYARGVGASQFAAYANGFDPTGRTYLDNIDVFTVMDNAIAAVSHSEDPPGITSPAPGATITTSTVTFQWSAGTGVSRYWLGVGTSFNSVKTSPFGNIYSAATGTNTTQQVTGIPINGNPVYVRLWWKIGATWTTADYTFQTQGTGNQTPIAVNDSAVTAKNTLVNVNVTANDTDPDGTIDPATVVVRSNPAHGTAVARVDGTVNYTPLTGYTGQDTFTYTVNDTLGATSNVAAVTITVNSSGGTPGMTSPAPGSTITTSTVTFQWSAGSGVSKYWLGVGTSFNSVKTSPFGNIYSAATGTNTTQQVTGIPINGNPVYVRLWWKIGTTWTTADYTFQTQGTGNQTPIAVNDSAVTAKNTLVNVNVTANDTDPDGTIDPATVVVRSNPAHGTAVARADGTVNYTPVTGYTGQDTFTYTVNDTLGATSNVAAVTITVNSSGGTPGMTSPAPGATITTSTVTFQWSAGTGVSRYWLGVGTSFNSVKTSPFGNIFGASTGTSTTQQVTGIPINGNPVYVRLWWKIGSTWFTADYTFQTQ
ncbi:MAG: alkaline phosphatase [Candidatus Scalindua sp.]|nr:alkaline phosphatase [Candidatus Scalindua sp.]